ncbi:MAG: hypothetical protein BAJALOKI1v1_1790007 [Promethearchaeota archaeon]|nr:MAG: hypothetical protein BAJALOKI1v1_1790007 [Candidatus Lokiarchaeota archaeon]
MKAVVCEFKPKKYCKIYRNCKAKVKLMNKTPFKISKISS